METLEFDHNLFNQAQEQEADKSLAVKFFMHPMKNEQRSIEEGRPIFEETPMIEIRVRGDRNNIVIHPVREDEKRRFARAWDAFKRNQEQTPEGTPLAEWPPMTASLVEEMKYLGYFTVEQVANANEVALGKVTGLRNLQIKAKLFLEMAKGSAPIEVLTEQIDQLNAQKEADKATIAAQAVKLRELEAKLMALAEKMADA